MKTRIAIPVILFAWLASAGCANTQIVGGRLSEDPVGPYRKILACSMDTEGYRRLLEETAVKRELNKRPLEAKTCSEFFGGLKSLTDQQAQARFEQSGFDAVVAWHRRPIIHMFEGPGKSASEQLTLGGLLQAYRRRILTPTEQDVTSEKLADLPVQDGRKIVEKGEVHILDAHTGRLVWNGDGAILGSIDAPLEIAAEDMAKRAVGVLVKDQIIP